MASEFTARDFDKSDHRSPAHFIWSHIKRHPYVAILMVFGAFANAALASYIPNILGQVFDVLDVGLETGTEVIAHVAQLALWLAASQLLRGGLQFMRNYSAEIFAQRVERDLRDELYAGLLGKNMAFHDSMPVGEIMSRVVNDVRDMNYFMSPGLNLLVGSSFFLVMPLIASFMIHPILGWVPVGFIVIYIFLQYNYTMDMYRISQGLRESFGDMNASLAESLDGIQVVKGAAQEFRETAEFSVLVDEVKENFIEQREKQARYYARLAFGLTIFIGAVISIMLYRQGQITTGDIVNFIGQLDLFGFPVFASSFSLLRLAQGYASSERILDVIVEKTDLDQNLAGHDGEIEGAIRFDHVDFAYTEEKTVLSDVDFEIYPGHTIALVGQTGSGKSSIAKLINRTYDVTEGKILVDGVDLRNWNLESLRSQISIIEQEIFLFSRSVTDNIRFGAPDATDEDVVEAAKKAQAHDFIMEMPEGYDTVIGQRGVTLSGGQRQRLAIARAFLTDPRILILDDSTSAIDSATEDKIQKAIWEAAKGRTTMIITHRLSQIRWADHIIVLRNGIVAAQGTHDKLLGESEAYQRIFARYEEPAAKA